MSIQDLLEKVAEAGVSLWDVKKYSFTIRDSNGNEKTIKDIKIDPDNKKIKVKID